MDADAFVLSALTDEELRVARRHRQESLREIEQEIARRRELKYGAPQWWCEPCQRSLRAPGDEPYCPECTKRGVPFTQSMLEIANG